jgi:hypothetical protein
LENQTRIISRRWDGLGGRLNSLLNAWSMARELGLAFQFIWPRNAFKELCHPNELFGEGFLERYEIPESTSLSCKQLPFAMGWTRAEVLEFCRTNRTSTFEIDNCFDVTSFADETKEAAVRRFRAAVLEIEWNSALRRLMEQWEGIGPYFAIHVRAGDIVTGGWRHFVPVEKYTPMALVECAVESLSEQDHAPVVVVTDNAVYLDYLKSRFERVRAPGDLIDVYSELTPAQQTFADILVLSRARRLVAPPMSAFSQLASLLGDVLIEGVQDVMPEASLRRRFTKHCHLMRKEVARADFLRPLMARDICWFLDVLSDELPPDEHLRLAHEAVEYDPDFCGALNRKALGLALAGDHQGSRVCSRKALEMATQADRHDDPLVESLAVSIAASVLAILDRRNTDSQTASALLARAREDAERCGGLSPFQIHQDDMLLNLSFQLAAANWMSSIDPPLRERVEAMMQDSGGDQVELKAWRPSGFQRLAEPGSFPQSERNLEIISIRFAQAMGRALAADPRSLLPRTKVHVDALMISPSGLHWAIGWALGNGVIQGGFALKNVGGHPGVSGGLTYLSRPDVAQAFKDPRAARCGFCAPIPLPAETQGQ